MQIKTIYEDENVLVVEKPAGLVVFPEGQAKEHTLIDKLIVEHPALKSVGEPPRYGVVHRLDKDTSGILLVAKTNEALIFLQKQFSASAKALADKKNSPPLEKNVKKRYITLVEGTIKNDTGIIDTFIARSSNDKRKQTVYQEGQAMPPSARRAITEYKVLERFKDYTLLNVEIKTGRRHQIRCHFSFMQHPVAGDTLYRFKNSKVPEGLTRQFLHAYEMKILLPNGQTKEFVSPLPADLQETLDHLEKII